MQILGKEQIQGKEKEILLLEEDVFFKYYTLELVGAYTPQMREQKIIFKKDMDFSEETKLEMIKLVNHKMTSKMLQEGELLQILGQVKIEGKQKEVVIKKEGEIFKYYYLNLIGVYTPKIPGETIIFKQDTLENEVANDIKDNRQRSQISPLEKEKILQLLQRIKIRDILDRIQASRKRCERKNTI